MKSLILFFLFFIFSSLNTFGKKNKTDTIYVICYQENLAHKFYNINQSRNQLRINYFFDVKWVLYEQEQTSFFFSYSGPEKQIRNEWSIPLIDLKSMRNKKKIYTLKEFTSKLTGNFLTSAFLGKFQIIMLYGTKNGSKFEIFPVQIGTDLSSEG